MGYKKGGGNKLQPYDCYGKYLKKNKLKEELGIKDETKVELKKKLKALYEKRREKAKKLLTAHQKCVYDRIENTIRDHCKDSDYDAIKIEMSGGIILDKNGDTCNHIQEGKDAFTALRKCKHNLEKF